MSFSQRLLRLPVLIERTGISRSGIYARLNSKSRYFDPSFPRPISLSPSGRGAVAWLAHEVEAWIELRAAQSRATQLPKCHQP